MKSEEIRKFFTYIYARSSEDNGLRFNLNTMTLNSSQENLGIKNFSDKTNQNLQKLFKAISFLAKNKSKLKVRQKNVETDLDIKSIYE